MIERDIERFSDLINLEENIVLIFLNIVLLTCRMEWMVMVILMIALELLRGGGAIKRLYEDSITNLLQPTCRQIKTRVFLTE